MLCAFQAINSIVASTIIPSGVARAVSRCSIPNRPRGVLGRPCQSPLSELYTTVFEMGSADRGWAERNAFARGDRMRLGRWLLRRFHGRPPPLGPAIPPYGSDNAHYDKDHMPKKTLHDLHRPSVSVYPRHIPRTPDSSRNRMPRSAYCPPGPTLQLKTVTGKERRCAHR